MRKTIGGPAVPAKAITTADLVENGGDYTLATKTAIAISATDNLDRGLQPIPAKAFLPVTEAQITNGEYKLMGGRAVPVYEVSSGYEDDGLIAYPVYVNSGNFGAGGQPEPPGYPLLEELVSYWPMDSLVGGITPDVHGDNDMSDLTGGGSTGAGKIGSAIVVGNDAGGRTYGITPQPANLKIGGGSVSISFWVLINDFILFSGGRLMGSYDGVDGGPGQTDFYIGHDPTPSLISFVASDNAPSSQTATSTDAIVADWAFVVVTFDWPTRVVKFYVNGSPSGSTTMSDLVGTAIADTSSAFSIGMDEGTVFVSGMIDEVSFHRRVLTPAEVTAMWNGGSGMSYAQLAAYTG